MTGKRLGGDQVFADLDNVTDRALAKLTDLGRVLGELGGGAASFGQAYIR